MLLTTDRPRSPVRAGERTKIDRNVLRWLNTFPDRPEEGFTTESHLLPDRSGIALSAMTSAYINKSYIIGGYEAEYQFRVIRRIKPGGSMDRSLQADELLNCLGDWAIQNPPGLGEGIQVVKAEPTSQAELCAVYDNGDEDHHILMKIIYEVM